MLCDTMDMTAATELAHRRLSDFIWRQSKAYKFNEALLVHFTKCAPADWPMVWAGLQDKGWKVAGDYLIHAGVIESHNAAQEEYARECNQTAMATARKTGVLKTSQCVPDGVTGIVTIHVTTSVTPDAAQPAEPKPNGKPQAPKPAVRSPERQSPTNGVGTKLTFSMLSRMALEIKENKTDWCYDNHKLKPEDLVTAGLVGTLRPFVDRITDRQAREAWAEAATKTHQAAVDGMNITHSLAHYAIGIWRDEMNRLAAPLSN